MQCYMKTRPLDRTGLFTRRQTGEQQYKLIRLMHVGNEQKLLRIIDRKGIETKS